MHDKTPENPTERTMMRSGGQLLGSLEELLPCFYLARPIQPGTDLKQALARNKPGHFVFGVHGEYYRHLHIGTIFPIALCRDAGIRSALEEVAAILQSGQSTMAQRRRAVQSPMKRAFGRDMMWFDWEAMEDMFALNPVIDLFECLDAHFEYVTEVRDNPAGAVHITASARPTEWGGPDYLKHWHRRASRLIEPIFVARNINALPLWGFERRARGCLRGPIEHSMGMLPPVPCAGLPDKIPAVRLEMGQGGRAKLHMSLGDEHGVIHLHESEPDISSPFEKLAAWSREIDEGSIPRKFTIHEEKAEVVLTALGTDDPARVLLRLTREHFGDTYEVFLEGAVSRTALAAALKNELRRFFAEEFNPQEWDMWPRRAEGSDNGCMYLHERLQYNHWLWGR